MQKNKEIMSWLKNTWTKHRDNIETTKAENLERRNLPKRWSPDDREGKQLLKYSGWMKRITDKWNKSRGWYEARTTNIRENGQDLEEKLFFGLQMSTRNNTKITEVLRENESREVEPTMKWFEIDLGKACDWWNPFLHHTWKELRILRGNIRVR